MAETLKNKTVKGTIWSFLDNIANQGITFIVGLVLARILTPKEYGIIGIILIFIAVFNSIVDSGFSNALIRKKDSKDIDYNTVFIVNLGLSILLFALLIFCAPFIGDFFDQPELSPLTRVMAVIVIINAFAIIPRTLLIKKIDFKTQTKISLIASIVSGVVGIGMALTNFGVWALVGQQISRQLVNTTLLWVFSHWRPIFEFSRSSFHELFGFGWKLLVSSLIDTIWKELYQVVIGKFYAPATLGQYTRALQFGSIFSSNLTSIVQRVSYPVLSTIQDDKVKLKDAYRRIIRITMLVSFICMLNLGAIAKPMIFTLIGEKWAVAVPMLQIICVRMMIFPLHSLNLNMLQVQGRSDLFLRLEIIKKIFAVGPLCLGIFVGIWWMLVGSVLSSFFAYYLNAFYSGKFLNYNIWQQIKDILPSFMIALCIAVPTYFISYLDFKPYILLGIQLVVGGSLCIILLEIFKISEYKELREIILKLIHNKSLK